MFQMDNFFDGFREDNYVYYTATIYDVVQKETGHTPSPMQMIYIFCSKR